MKKLSILAAAAAIAVSATAPVSAQQATPADPFSSSVGLALLPLFLTGAATVVVLGAAVNSGSGTN